ncbi:unnamed protein product [Eruca vesicaria subsp. sativa]|uniref:Uncharacterized protein n=1 Tax=Eruca vesicaria subsp. sativa TaxID=29727 RepID=A0ABC8LF86_ERUVS|nr:unnamed protein product [Eruca vesicaria subsp. sativa]
MSLLMGQPQQMSYAQDLPSVASMDDNNNRYHQLPITSQMPSTTTTTNSINAAPDLLVIASTISVGQEGLVWTESSFLKAVEEECN